MSRLTKWLETKTKEVEYHTSGSSYFQFGDRLIRVSDHLPPVVRQQDLYILTSANAGAVYMIAVGGKTHSFIKLGKVKEFIENWIIFIKNADYTIERTDSSKIKQLREKVVDLNNRLTRIQGSNIKKGKLPDGEDFIDLSKYPPKQRHALIILAKRKKSE